MNQELRRQVINVYKGVNAPIMLPPPFELTLFTLELLEMGKSYPLGYSYFRPRLHKAFSSKSHLKDEEEIRKGIQQAEYVKKEIEALSVVPVILGDGWEILSIPQILSQEVSFDETTLLSRVRISKDHGSFNWTTRARPDLP